MKHWITHGGGVGGGPRFQTENPEWILAGRAAQAGRMARKAERRKTDEGRAERREEARRRREKNPEAFAQARLMRKYRERGAEGSHTLAEWETVLAAHGGSCAYCGRSDIPITRDHRVPISRGGSNFIDNIVPACRPCNSRKGARL